MRIDARRGSCHSRLRGGAGMTKRTDQPHVCGYDDCEAKSEVSASLTCWLCLGKVKTRLCRYRLTTDSPFYCAQEEGHKGYHAYDRMHWCFEPAEEEIAQLRAEVR